MPRRSPEPEPHLRGPEGHPTVYLLDAATDLEVRMLERWLRRRLGAPPETCRITSSRRGRGGDPEALEARLAAGDDPYLIPVRVVWLAPKKRGRRRVGWSDFFKPGDPRDPWRIRATLIKTFKPSRVRMIAAPGASASQLATDYETSGEIDGLASFVTRRAWLALEREERKLRGNRFKIPRFVPEAILSRREFVDQIEDFAARASLDPSATAQRAEKYLREIAATHSPYVIDLIAGAIRALYSQGYGGIYYDPAEVEQVAELEAEYPVAFLPSHRSNMDRLSLQFMLWENDLPPNHTAGGINLNFFPVGPLIRRTGVFFIRRSFRDNHLYKIVLRAYLDYLIEKRFPLEWYMEGGRSRTGKLLPPRLGLLNYVVDSQRRGKADDIKLVPVSIAYDHIHDVPDYAREAAGKGKERESFGWLVRKVRSLRRRHGNIYIRFGDPVSVADVVGSIPPGEEVSLELQKLAFEVMYRIGRVTPITPTALVSIVLLAARGEARTVAQLGEECARIGRFIEDRNLPTTVDLNVADPGFLAYQLEVLAEHGNVSSHEAAGRRVFWLDDEQMIRVSYYRNMVVHFFVPRAIAEVAFTALADTGERDPDLVHHHMLELRDLLKFEFYFPERDQFLKETFAEIEIDVPDWRGVLGRAGPLAVLAKMGPPMAHWALLPFLDAYQVVGDELADLREPFEEKEFLRACLARARMYRIEGQLISGESASQVLFKTALSLAHNRDLINDAPDVAERRAAFAAAIRAARERAALGL